MRWAGRGISIWATVQHTHRSSQVGAADRRGSELGGGAKILDEPRRALQISAERLEDASARCTSLLADRLAALRRSPRPSISERPLGAAEGTSVRAAQVPRLVRPSRPKPMQPRRSAGRRGPGPTCCAQAGRSWPPSPACSGALGKPATDRTEDIVTHLSQLLTRVTRLWDPSRIVACQEHSEDRCAEMSVDGQAAGRDIASRDHGRRRDAACILWSSLRRHRVRVTTDTYFDLHIQLQPDLQLLMPWSVHCQQFSRARMTALGGRTGFKIAA
jgi:hypothetical protein